MALLRKMTCNLRHPMGLRHWVSNPKSKCLVSYCAFAHSLSHTLLLSLSLSFTFSLFLALTLALARFLAPVLSRSNPSYPSSKDCTSNSSTQPLQHVVLLYKSFVAVAVRCSVLQCVAVCCSVSQCVAVCRSVLQRVAVCRCTQYVSLNNNLTFIFDTGWQRCTGCLIFLGHFPPKSPTISVSYAGKDLQLKASYASSPLCATMT